MNFDLIEPGLILQSGGLENLLDIPMAPGRSFKTNIKLSMIEHVILKDELSLYSLRNVLETPIAKISSFHRSKLVHDLPKQKFQIEPNPNDAIIDLNLGNRPIALVEMPLALTEVHYNTIVEEPRQISRNTFILKYLSTRKKQNGKNRPKRSVGDIRYWHPRRSVLCAAIQQCTQ